MFNITYQTVGSALYRILIEPKGYIFLYNATFTVTTKALGAVEDFSALGYPFSNTTYQATSSLTWFVIKGPPFS